MYRSRIVLPTFVWWATCCPPYWFKVFDFSSPVRRLDQLQGSGGLGEHCSSPAVGRGVCAPPGRVAQPRLLAADRGNPVGAANRGRLLFGYFFLAKQEKVISCRATPGGVDLSLFELCWVPLRSTQPTYCPGEVDFGHSCFDTAFGLLNTNGIINSSLPNP